MDYAELSDEPRYKRESFVGRINAEQRAKIGGGPAYDNWPTFNVVILDRFDGTARTGTIRAPMIRGDDPDAYSLQFSYEDGVQDKDWFAIMPYMVNGHFCGCHRASAIEGRGNPVADEPGGTFCPGSRFVVMSVTHAALPGVVLYYETPTGEYVTESESADERDERLILERQS